LIGILLLVALVMAIVVLESDGVRLLWGLAIGVGVFGTLQAFTRRLALLDDHFLVRDIFWRVRSFGYSEVRDVFLDPQTVLGIYLRSGETIRFPAKLANVDQACEIVSRKIGHS
jgi:hypothetical protein